MKQAFSCSDFLNDLWQNTAEIPDALPGLQCPDESDNVQFSRETSPDMLNLLGGPQEAGPMPSLGAFTASSTSGRDLAGAFTLTGDHSGSARQDSANHSLLQDAFMRQPASPTFSRAFDASDLQPQAKRARITPQAAFPMDTVQQARAICHSGQSITALQQQLQELKGNSGLENFVQCNQPSVSTALQEPCQSMVPSLVLQGTPGPASPTPSPLSHLIPTTAEQQPQLGLQQDQLRQLAQLLGSANVSALRNMTAPAPPHATPDPAVSSARLLSNQLQECATSSAAGLDHSSGDDDTGALGDLHKLTGMGEDAEEPWESKLDASLPPPEMKRMRRMLSNRESARRSRRRKQAHMQDLEVTNQELVDINEKLQKEIAMLRNMAKEAVLEKKKSQAALEAFKHQVVHVLGEHNIVLNKDTLPQQPAQHGTTGAADSAGSESMQLAINTIGSGSPTSHAPVAIKGHANGRTSHKLPKPPSSPCTAGSKRKACDV